jgi:hypothetical protein
VNCKITAAEDVAVLHLLTACSKAILLSNVQISLTIIGSKEAPGIFAGMRSNYIRNMIVVYSEGLDHTT